jgi:hypothetical protein
MFRRACFLLFIFSSAAVRAQVIINEVAWGGTAASANHEWIEVWNASSSAVALDGWRLISGDGKVKAALKGSILGQGFYLLERSTDAVVSDVPADAVYTGSLANGGVDLFLLDPSSAVVDSARFASGWPAGSGSPDYRSMERVSPSVSGDLASNWIANDGTVRNGLDAKGAPLNGTPRARNSAHASGDVVPSTAALREVVINEVAWGGTSASSTNEWVELLSNSTRTLSLDGLRLSNGDGVVNVALHGLLPAGGYFLLERTSDASVGNVVADQIYTGGLSNGGEDLFLLDAASTTIDSARFSAGGWPAGTGSPDYKSMERVTPSAGGDLRNNWKSNDGATRTGTDAKGEPLNGTPRARNSAYSPVLPPSSTGNGDTDGGGSGPFGGRLVVDPATNPFSPRDPNPGRRAALIYFDAESSQAAKTIRVCDVRGETVRTFSDADVLFGEARGRVAWDGTDENGRLLPPGIYIVHLEAVDPGGGRRTGKATVVLGYPK